MGILCVFCMSIIVYCWIHTGEKNPTAWRQNLQKDRYKSEERELILVLLFHVDIHNNIASYSISFTTRRRQRHSTPLPLVRFVVDILLRLCFSSCLLQERPGLTRIQRSERMERKRKMRRKNVHLLFTVVSLFFPVPQFLILPIICMTNNAVRKMHRRTC